MAVSLLFCLQGPGRAGGGWGSPRQEAHGCHLPADQQGTAHPTDGALPPAAHCPVSPGSMAGVRASTARSLRLHLRPSERGDKSGPAWGGGSPSSPCLRPLPSAPPAPK